MLRAVHALPSSTETESSLLLAAYRLWVAESKARDWGWSSCSPPTPATGAGVVEHPCEWPPLHAVASITDTVLPPPTMPNGPLPLLATYTVPPSADVATAFGAPPTACVGGLAGHPVGCLALHVVVSSTDTVLSAAFAT